MAKKRSGFQRKTSRNPGTLLATSELLGMPPRCKGNQIQLRTAPQGTLEDASTWLSRPYRRPPGETPEGGVALRWPTLYHELEASKLPRPSLPEKSATEVTWLSTTAHSTLSRTGFPACFATGLPQMPQSLEIELICEPFTSVCHFLQGTIGRTLSG